MPTLEEALSAAFDGPTETPAPAPEPVPAAEGDADTAPDLTAASPDALFQMSEQLRAEAQNPTTNPYAQLPPQVAAELQSMRQYVHQQTQQQVIQQIEGAFAQLTGEFGGNAIPETQRLHVLETVQQ